MSPRSIRLLRQQGADSVVVDLNPVDEPHGSTPRARQPALHVTEMEKLKRLVERPFGELLFASAVVIGDGATERAFLPPILRRALGIRGQAVCVIDPGSMGNELTTAAVKFAKLVAIPWLLFSDADQQGQRDAARIIKDHADGDSSHVVFGGASSGDGLTRGAIEAMLVQFDEDLCRAACFAVNAELSASSSTLGLLKSVKGSAGSSLAQLFLERHPDVPTWPLPLRKLLERLKEQP